MVYSIPETDWKKLRSLKDAALNTACERILLKISSVLEARGTESYKCYIKLWEIIQSEDKEIALMFDDLKRSTAIFKLASWRMNGLLSDDDLEKFTEETQERIQLLSDINRE